MNLALLVRLGESLHAIPIQLIEEVLPNLPMERVPQCPAFIKGVVFVRGHLIPVLDSRERLGLPEQNRAEDPHIVCVRAHGRMVGLEVDEALDLIEIDADAIVGAEALGARAGFFVGLVEQNGHVIRVLDPDKMLGRDETEHLERVPRTS